MLKTEKTVAFEDQELVAHTPMASHETSGVSIDTSAFDSFRDSSSPTITLPLKDIHVVESLWARSSLDQFTVDKYADAIFLGESFPLIVVTHREGKWVIVDGVHRYEAYRRIKNDDYEIECSIFSTPGGDHLIVHSADLNRQNGRGLSSDDLRKAANILYLANYGAPIDALAKKLKINPKTLKKYVGPLEAEYKKKKDKRIAELRKARIKDCEIEKILKKEFPFANGVTRASKAMTNSNNKKLRKSRKAQAASCNQNINKNGVLAKSSDELTFLYNAKPPVIMVRKIEFLRPRLQQRLVEEIKAVVDTIRLEELDLRKKTKVRTETTKVNGGNGLEITLDHHQNLPHDSDSNIGSSSIAA